MASDQDEVRRGAIAELARRELARRAASGAPSAQAQPAALDPSEYDPSSSEYQAKYGATSGMGRSDKFLAGAGKAFVDLGRGAGQLVGLESNQDVQNSRERDAPLMQSGYAKAGNIVGGVASLAPTMAIPGANTIAGAGAIGAASGLLQPATSVKERATNTAIGGATGAATQYVGQKIAGWVGQKIAARTAAAESEAAQNSVRDATLSEARQAGYVVPPSTTNPTTANRIAESLSGKAATQQTAAVRNQLVTNNLVRADLGMAKDAPITPSALEGIRKTAGNAYKAVKAAGQVATDGQYLDDLAKIGGGLDEIAKDFPEANVGAGKEIHDLVDTLLKDKFNASSAVEYTKQLRFAASSNLANSDNPTSRALGMAQKEAAGALEDMVMRHLEQSGKGSLAQKFNEARTLIAKTYTVEGALNESTGNVVATALSRELKKGKPLTGGIATAAKFAQAFPKAAREITDSPGVSAVDALVGGVGAATVNPAMAGLPAARIGARAAILSKGYQANMGVPNYAPNTGGLEALKYGADNALLPALVTVTYPEKK